MTNYSLIKKLPNWLLLGASILVSFFFIIFLIGWYFSDAYEDKIAPKVTVAGVVVGGKTIDQARPIIEEIFTKLDNGIPISFKQKKINIASQINLSNPDVAPQLVFFDLENTLNNAFAIGHSGNSFNDILVRFKSYLFGTKLDVSVTVDREAIIKELKDNFSSEEIKPTNASVQMINGETKIIKEQTGLVLDYDRASEKIISQLHLADASEIVIESKIVEPTVFENDIENNLLTIKDYLNFSKTKLVYKDESWDLDVKLAGQWLGFSKKNGQIEVILDQEKIKQFLIDEVVKKVNHEPVQARLSMSGGRASIWQAGQDGVELELDKTAALIAAWPKDRPEKIEVVIKTIPTGSADVTAESLGLKEIIGTGTSNFTGSPANRRHNIKVGANTLNGLLIKPGEEFSLLRALGKIDGSTGYKQELVIKENKTTPEYGGGLCQIGTTMFRATFNSGLPVTQRRNHSYRVVYYEPAGTDATIYDPAPDYRFVNDTGHHILIQARIGKDSLAFDFWGTKDGRQIEFTKPVVYNIVKPAPTKIVETTDLKEGEKKCTESSHNGADAYFDYKVTYLSGEEKKVRFSSHYVPWQAVCLLGVKKLPDTATPGTITGTVTPTVTPTIAPVVSQ